MAEQENIEQNTVFHFSLDTCDIEIAEWILQQPNKDAYLKSLILADKAQREGTELAPQLRQGDARWEMHFEMLKEFRDEFGRFPTYSESYRGFRLGRWLHDTARRARANRPDRIEKLQSIGALDKWERNYLLAKSFFETYKRLPSKNELFRDVRIGAWLSLQATRLRNDKSVFSSEQLDKLGELGLCASDWDKKFEVLKAFAAEYGRLPKYVETYGEIRIGRWLAHQRKALDPLKHADRAERLHKLCASPYAERLKKENRLRIKA